MDLVTEAQLGLIRPNSFVFSNNRILLNLNNTASGGPILCATDQPQLVRTDARSCLHCSTTCLQNDQCSSFNYKDTDSTCEHFTGYPFKFIVDPACRHYAVRSTLKALFKAI